MKNKKKIIFLDINNFSHEGFTSGLFISIKQMLREFLKYDFTPSIFSITEDFNKNKNYITKTKIDNINIVKCFVNYSIGKNKLSETTAILNKYLKREDPKIIFINTPAIFFNRSHIIAAQEALNNGSKVVTIVVDELFPTSEKFSKKLVDEYYNLIKKTEVLAISDRIAKKLSVFGLKPQKLPQLFDLNRIIAKEKTPKYITLINTHPIKGLQIFNKIAKKMPDKNFLIVESWPDVPEYSPSSNNIKIKKFNKDIKNIFKLTKILLVPSLCQEGIARVVIESMANGIPVIANRIGSLPEIDKKVINFIDPPTIKKYKLINTILYPIINKEDLEIVVNKYIKKINNIYSKYTKYSSECKKVSKKHITSNKKEMNKMIKKLLK